MFEKEADYIKARKESKDKITKVISAWSAREETIHDEGFQKGAEFGYNKANEWHYVKDGDLPEHEVNVLVLCNTQCIDIAHYNFDYEEWHSADSIVCDVIAWKEVVLPKEIKEND